MDKFLSCDWGTSSFRLRLVRYDNLEVIAEEKNDNGIANTYKLWQQAGADPATQQIFYQSVIAKNIDLLSGRLGENLPGIPIIISGMISSTIGMIGLPYKECPVAIEGSDLEIKMLTIEGSDNALILISGIKTAHDIIRGEETKIVGCASYLDNDSEQLIIFMGTHPKHVTIQNKMVTGIKTYMTGEFFNLLTTQSILASSIKSGGDFYQPENQRSFKKGVEDSLAGNLLQLAFGVRINELLKNIPAENNFFYLSGLLIGAELKDVLNYKHQVYLCGAVDIAPYYKLACDVLCITISAEIDADEALLRGQKEIYQLVILSASEGS